jgi:hypothetical protein
MEMNPVTVRTVMKTKKDKVHHLLLTGDWHKGHEETNYNTIHNYMYWITSEENHSCIWMGDMYEFSIPTHMPFTLQNQNIDPKTQWQILLDDIGEWKPLLYLTGNHERRIIKNNWVTDPFEQLCNQYKIAYSRVGLFFYLRLPTMKQNHLMYLSHGRGGQYWDSGFKTLRNMHILTDVSVAAMAHTHHLKAEAYDIYRLLKGKVHVVPQWWIRTGSALVNPEYASRHTLRPNRAGFPILSFERDTPITVSLSLKQWGRLYG